MPEVYHSSRPVGQGAVLEELGVGLRLRDVQKPVQAAAIQVGQIQELDAEFTMIGPADGGGVDGNRRTQIGGPNEEPYT